MLEWVMDGTLKGRFDERDTIFSRVMELEPGTALYRDYYRRHPEREEGDRLLRAAAEGVFSRRLTEQREIDAVFALLKDLRSLAGHPRPGDKRAGNKRAGDKRRNLSSAAGSGTPRAAAPDLAPEQAAAELKRLARSYGAADCGIAVSDPAWFYSVRGRGPHYGEPVEGILPRTVVFTVEMDEAAVGRAPAVEEAREVVSGYFRAAAVGLVLSYTLRTWGFRAVCHMDGESRMVMPPAAEAAGLGRIGLPGLLVTPRYGSRIRLGAVTTDGPLGTDGPGSFDVSRVCRTCGRCAAFCPSGAIPAFDSYAPGEAFRIDHEACFRTWKELGTDCGVCLAVCPFSRKDKKRAAGSGGNSAASFLKDFMFGDQGTSR